PTLVLTVQNSVPKRDMSSATAGVNFFRQIGASFGTALIGSLFVSRLADNLADSLPPSAAGQLGESANAMTSEKLAQLPPDLADTFVKAYSDALMPLYLYLVPLLLLGVLMACLLKEKPLQNTARRGGRSVPPAGSGGSASGGDAGPGQPGPDGPGPDGSGSDGSGSDGPGGPQEPGGAGNSGNGSGDAGDREKAAPVHVQS